MNGKFVINRWPWLRSWRVLEGPFWVVGVWELPVARGSLWEPFFGKLRQTIGEVSGKFLGKLGAESLKLVLGPTTSYWFGVFSVLSFLERVPSFICICIGSALWYTCTVLQAKKKMKTVHQSKPPGHKNLNIPRASRRTTGYHAWWHFGVFCIGRIYGLKKKTQNTPKKTGKYKKWR